jgi:O-antigen/teichoic acid export membrane protein
VIALAYVFQGANRFFLAGTYIAKKTSHLGIVGVISAGANVALNLLLIPRFGMMGAAWATAFSFMAMSLLSLAVSQRVYRIPYVFARLIGIIGMAAVIYIASTFVVLPSVTLQVVSKCLLFTMFPIVLYMIGFFSDKEVQQSKTLTQALLSRYRLLRPAESK